MASDPQGSVTITSLGQIEALANPVRSRILRHARSPITVAELAERFDVPKTRLYYHVNLLVEEGFLVQIDERKSGARIEKIYLRTGRDFKLAPDLTETLGDTRKAAEAAAAVIFDPARAEVEDVLELVFADEKPAAQFGRTIARLSDQDIGRFRERLAQLMSDIREADSSHDKPGRTYSYTSAFVPVENGEGIP